MPAYTSEYFGGTAIISVATFANLPATGELGQKISVTAESLFNNSYPVIVTYENSNSITGWKLLSARCTYVNLAAAEFNSGNWVGTATIPTSIYGNIIDTTYNESWTWNSSGIFFPSYLSLTTINYHKKIKGNTVSLDAEWTKTENTGCSVTTDGSKLTLAATGDAGQRVATVSFVDAGSTSATKFYMKCLFQRTALVAGSGGASHTTMEYFSSSAGYAGIFGDSRSSNSVTYPNIDGRFFNKGISSGQNWTKTSSVNSDMATETLVQYRAYDKDGNGNMILQAKAGNQGWRDISAFDVAGGSGPIFSVGSYAKGAGGTATCKLRYLQAIRYT